MKAFKTMLRIILKVPLWGFLLLVILAIASALYNLSLPDESEKKETLDKKEKACISEAQNLIRKTGNRVWPGFGDVQVPVIVYNEEYAFLTGHPDPPAGWYKMPQYEFRGTEWEVVPGDDGAGSTYYRQRLTDPESTPENFTVLVGEKWAATAQTKEYAAVAFYSGFRDELPPVLKTIFPYGIFWKVLMGTTENYIGALVHEAFHAFQGTRVPQRFADAERAASLYSEYPWHDTANGWGEETGLLLRSFNAETTADATQLVKEFLLRRDERRKKANLPLGFVKYEQKREWLEGLAKYAELKIGMMAADSPDYKPVKEIETISGFKHYKTRVRHFNQQIGEVKRAVNRHGENRFYYTGMLQAVMLDRLMPEWKNEAFDEDVYLEDLLRIAAGKY